MPRAQLGERAREASSLIVGPRRRHVLEQGDLAVDVGIVHHQTSEGVAALAEQRVAVEGVARPVRQHDQPKIGVHVVPHSQYATVRQRQHAVRDQGLEQDRHLRRRLVRLI